MIDSYLSLTDTQKELFERLYALMAESPVNITAIKDKDEYYIKHVLDSLYFFENSPHTADIRTIADIGSGGGFPGLPLAIKYPDKKITLIESIAKKCAYLENTVQALGLKNVEIICVRAEQHVGQYDLITARGAGTVKEIFKYTKQLTNKAWLMYKGEKLESEIKQATRLIENNQLVYAVTRVEDPFMRSYFYIGK
jgi:16S rRNA (guanine527-N7)-methyltransferase